ncbi:hypothetical protein CsSME_00051550 [Camellia sinensis var. sinensis]
MVSKSSKAIQMLFIVVCIAMRVTIGLAQLPDPVPSPENWQPGCWEYFPAVEVCIYEIYWFLKMGKTGYVGPDCCKTINVVGEKCSWKLFPSMSFLPQIVQSYCGQPTSQGGAPAPVGISPSVSQEQEVPSLDNK